ncbi:MAG: hypothetical protein KatS3mg109_2079 [Pirellulaceae bacterium]|nr:MAG: hypothetical protein KatS3mg109_1979 [Pirellulaceae bacterium]GIW91647.1 MAG: hypothetical protein KatS3mg109_2079 [Pirellulaceae bacterium]
MMAVDALLVVCLYVAISLLLLGLFLRYALRSRRRRCGCKMCQILLIRARRRAQLRTDPCPICGHAHWTKKVVIQKSGK